MVDHSVVETIYCPDAYLIVLVVRLLLALTFTQIISCIGRLQSKSSCVICANIVKNNIYKVYVILFYKSVHYFINH